MVAISRTEDNRRELHSTIRRARSNPRPLARRPRWIFARPGHHVGVVPDVLP